MQFLKKIRTEIRRQYDMYLHKKSITVHFAELKNRRRLSKKQKKEVIELYKKLIGKKVSTCSHEYFYSRTGVFTKYYVPKDLYHVELLPRANHWDYKIAFGDKNLCDLYLRGENLVHAFLKNINGYYYYEGTPVTVDDAVRLCSDLGKTIIKPSMDSQGNRVRMIDLHDGIDDETKESVIDLFDEYRRDFLIERYVIQHKDMAALNPSSVNTLRFLSYRSGMEILIVYCVIRIGRAGSVIDNQCAGGISTMVDNSGRLCATAYGGYSTDEIYKTDSGIVLEGYEIPSYNEASDMVKRMHLRMPFFDLIGWDVAIEENGSPILLEYNTIPGLSQSAFHSGFGDLTERIVKELWNKPNTSYRY